MDLLVALWIGGEIILEEVKVVEILLRELFDPFVLIGIKGCKVVLLILWLLWFSSEGEREE